VIAVRTLRLLIALPGQLLIRAIDDRKRANGVPPLGKFLRGCVHGFVWVVVLMAFSMAVTPTVTPASTPPPRIASRYVPPPIPSGVLQPVGSRTPEAPAPVDVPSVDVPGIDLDRPHLRDGALTGGYCAHKWWC
jgi:hypothetical protein